MTRIERIEKSDEDDAPMAFRRCKCDGQDERCPECGGDGDVYIPHICLFMCGEAFETVKELHEHMLEKHGVGFQSIKKQ